MTRYRLKYRVIIAALALSVAACGGGEAVRPGAPQPTATAPAPTAQPAPSATTPRPTAPASTAASTAPAPRPTASPIPTQPAVSASPSTPQDAGLAKAIANAQADLMQKLGVTSQSIQIVQAQPVEWPDSSLGCPQPGMMYSQVMTPGYKAILSVGGKQYTYTGDGSANMKLCETGTPQAANAPSGGGGGPQAANLAPQVAAAKADLKSRVTTLKEEDIKLTVAEEVTWNDGSLGCAQPGMMYTMALVPGYRIVLEANGQVYNYHGGKGQPPRLCAQPTGRPRGLGGTITPGETK